MFHLFREELDAAFQEDRKLRWKLLAGVVVGLVLGIKLTAKFWFAPEEDQHGATPLVSACATGALAVLCVVLVLALSLKDIVKRRVCQQQPVSFLLRCYLAYGFLSLALWVVTAIGGTILATVCWASWFG